MLPAYHRTLTTTRRTPADFLTLLQQLDQDRLDVVPFEQTDRAWLRSQYDEAAAIWVSEDSASMVYEGLSASGRVGMLVVSRTKTGRVARGLDRLVADGLVTSVDAVRQSGSMPIGAWQLSEANRVAQFLENWLHTGVPATANESPAGIA